MGKINITAGQDKRVEVALELAKGMNNLTEVLRELKAPAPSQISINNCSFTTKAGETSIDVRGDENFMEDMSTGYGITDDDDYDEDEDFCDDCENYKEDCECESEDKRDVSGSPIPKDMSGDTLPCDNPNSPHYGGPKVNFENPHVLNAISNMYNVSPYELVHGVQNAGTDDEFIVEDTCAPLKFSTEEPVKRCAIRGRRYQQNRGKRK